MKRLVLAGLMLSSLSVPVPAAENGDDIFNRMDTNRDQQLTLDEVLTGDIPVRRGERDEFLLGPTGQREEAVPGNATEKHKRALFERLDADRNGAVSRREWMDSVSTGLVIFRY